MKVFDSIDDLADAEAWNDLRTAPFPADLRTAVFGPFSPARATLPSGTTGGPLTGATAGDDADRGPVAPTLPPTGPGLRQLSSAHGGVNGLLGKAEVLRRQTGNAKAHCVAAAAVEIINRGRGGNKLPSWWKAQD